MSESERGVEAGAGAFRRAPVRDLCACGELAAKRCGRCDKPLCRIHAPSMGQRCAACEETYASILLDRELHPLRGWQLLLTYTVGIVTAAVAAICTAELAGRSEVYLGDVALEHWLLLPVALLAGALPIVVIHWRRVGLRRRFLRERPGRHTLRASSAGTSHLANQAEPRTVVPGKKPLQYASVGAVLASLFPIPLLPLIGAIVGIVAIATTPPRVGDPVADEKRGRDSAITAICVGLLATALQIAAICLLTSSHWRHLF